MSAVKRGGYLDQNSKKRTVTIEDILIILPYLFCIFLAFRVGKLESDFKSKLEEYKKENQEMYESLRQEQIKQNVGITDYEGMKKVYLTFDDGPSVHTKEILEILDKYNVKATFFVTGMNVPRYDEYYRKILEEGHSLGIHTYSHEYDEIYNSLESFQEDFNKIRDYVYHHTGEGVKLYRFPGGSINGYVSSETREQIMEWLDEEGIVYFDWNVSSGDAEKGKLSPEEIAENCIVGVEGCNTAIVLLHDAGAKKNTVEALPLIIEGINQLDNTVFLPMDEDTVAIRQINSTKE